MGVMGGNRFKRYGRVRGGMANFLGQSIGIFLDQSIGTDDTNTFQLDETNTF